MNADLFKIVSDAIPFGMFGAIVAAILFVLMIVLLLVLAYYSRKGMCKWTHEYKFFMNTAVNLFNSIFMGIPGAIAYVIIEDKEKIMKNK